MFPKTIPLFAKECARGLGLSLALFGIAYGTNGCGGPSSSGSTSSTSGSSATSATTLNASGNWQIQLTATSGAQLFPSLSGYIDQNITDSGATNYISTEFVAHAASGCYAGTNAIPGAGQIQTNQMSLTSFSVNGQYLDIVTTLDSSASTLTGTYQVSGGCADGATGTVTGTRYATLDGSYSGTMSTNSATMQLTLSQNSLGAGNGTFEVSGSGSFSGISCFTTATMGGTSGSVSGSTVELSFSTNDPSAAQLVLQGTMDSAADTLNISSIEITAGACAGSYGTASLRRQ